MSSFLVVGLGNPGVRYQKTRHNLGFYIVEYLADSAPFRKKNQAWVVEKEIVAKKVLLAKPRTFINLSGTAVLGLLTAFQIPPERLLVVCDDLALNFGQLRLRREGSAGGHNGLQSIIDAIGPRFARLRVGIGKPASAAEWTDYVLSPFTSEETEQLPKIARAAAELIEKYLAKENHNL